VKTPPVVENISTYRDCQAGVVVDNSYAAHGAGFDEQLELLCSDELGALIRVPVLSTSRPGSNRAPCRGLGGH